MFIAVFEYNITSDSASKSDSRSTNRINLFNTIVRNTLGSCITINDSTSFGCTCNGLYKTTSDTFEMSVIRINCFGYIVSNNCNSCSICITVDFTITIINVVGSANFEGNGAGDYRTPVKSD